MPMIITRRDVLLAAGAMIITPGALRSQPAKRIPRIGVLHPGLPPPTPTLYLLVALQKGMRDLRYVEGQTIAFEYRYAGGKPEALPALAKELIDLKVDILLVIGPAGTTAAKKVAGRTPM